MLCEVRFKTELPFTLNLPTATYPVHIVAGGAGVEVPVELLQEQWRLIFTDKPTSHDKFAMGSREELENLILGLPAELPKAWEELRTVVRVSFAEEFVPTPADIAGVPNKKVEEAILGWEIRQSPGPDAFNRAQATITSLTPEGRDDWAEKVLIDRFFDRLRNRKDFVLEAVNRLISHYRVITGDFFVERCTDHTLRIIHGEELIDGELYDMLYIVGKVPSWLKRRWNPSSADQVAALKSALRLSDAPNGPLELLSVARNQLEKGETRAAVIDASAALEAAVAQKITEKMLAAGNSKADVDRYLAFTKMDFRQRCDRQLKKCAKKSLVKESHLWGPVDAARKSYRHGVAHSDLRPLLNDAENAVTAFEAAVKFVIAL